MKRWTTVATALVGLAHLAAHAQGPLTPPGAPTPTMKTLAQIEPRTAITNVPHTISQPGSYYLTGNFTSATHGIVINADHVTVDLLGHTLTGSGGGATYGIYIAGASNAPRRNVTIRDGGVRGFGTGVHLRYANDSLVEGISSVSNTDYGIFLNGSNGGECNGNSIIRCSSSYNGTLGIFLDSRNNGRCEANAITDCRVYGNSSMGIYLISGSGSNNGNIIQRSLVYDNVSFGIYLNASGGGTCAGNTLSDCLVRNNATYGIFLSYANGNRIENNHVSRNTGASAYGIRTQVSSRNLIVRNTSVEHVNPYSFSAGDVWGPIVNTSGALANTGDESHPWANFAWGAP